MVNVWSTYAFMKKTLANYRLIVYTVSMSPQELRRWREKTGYSQGQLAHVLAVDVMTISRWERGTMRIPPFLKWALAYIELKGDELEPITRRTRTERKGGKSKK